ncbi:hypothetical protein [Flaviaesturariibacter aridisoli]|uniref:Uncharacterized protein n=1 Tax=Flaviaesturariibacter aridisoli TaxID=2545761 RepID=A0A4R4EAB7_9BACT|nr:hypothetical protein [Flaviaesturariibacter aridisoli]RYY63703.1 MAG: hypothetical protein EOO12_11610 [Chitinophagaceae bacterium]TCZ74765.1 hypothetical protein E0486_00225 [Flaviaesturariibacter aridisoli]
MKTAVTILLTGAAVAGLVYYFRDKEPVRKVLDRSNDLLANASDLVKEQYGKLAKKGQDNVAEMA